MSAVASPAVDVSAVAAVLVVLVLADLAFDVDVGSKGGVGFS